MESLDGPFFSPDLVGPDGRLTRLHKGGQHKANALAINAANQAKRQAQIDRIRGKRMAKQERNQARRERQHDNRMIAQQREMMRQDDENQPPPVQYYRDRTFGGSASFGSSAFGLGSTTGSRSVLG